MLERFDWLRLSRSGAELLATLQLLADDPEFPSNHGQLGPPLSALNGPCQRCWIYPRSGNKAGARYCSTCEDVFARAWRLGDLSRHAIVLWGWVNRLPRSLSNRSDSPDDRLLGAYVRDQEHFLAALLQKHLKSWLQDTVLYHGTDLKGFIQMFRTVGSPHITMGELLCRMVHGEGRFPMSGLHVRFFPRVHRVFHPHAYDREGVLTFDIAEFLRVLEMATVFRAVLRRDERRMLRELLQMEDHAQARFYWGRLLGFLSQEARDLLNAWDIREWSQAQISLLYDLIEYVPSAASR